ncbi:MAG: hypothetical protein HRT35_07290 [Algicola sp.]|nr:hypothetical protein [Algicola sp.]
MLFLIVNQDTKTKGIIDFGFFNCENETEARERGALVFKTEKFLHVTDVARLGDGWCWNATEQ